HRSRRDAHGRERASQLPDRRHHPRARRRNEAGGRVTRAAHAKAAQPFGAPLAVRAGLAAGVFLRFGDQLLDFLPALVSDLLVEVRAVLFLDDLAAFLADRLVEFRAVPLARGLPAFSPDLFVESRTVPVANGVAALFSRFTNRHLAFDLLGPCLRRRRFFRVGHTSAACFRRAFQLLTAFGADLFVERRAVLALRGLAAFPSNRFVELGSVLRFDAIAAAFPGFSDAHPAAGSRHVLVGRHNGNRPPELSAHRSPRTQRKLG